MADYEKLGQFYLGREYDLSSRRRRDGLVLYDSRDLVTHAVCMGMTGSGKTGLCLALVEEAALDGVPAIVIDPKGDLANLLLTFPGLRPDDFRPWINEDDARRNGQDPDTFAAAEATRWETGLGGWDQDGTRIARLRQAVDPVVFTPGSHAGIPVSVLRSFAAPPAEVAEDADLLRERTATIATSLLGLAGIDADPLRSREHILVSTIVEQAWRSGRDLDIATLIQQIQAPPITRVGVLELEAFLPAKDRFGLAMALNNLLAAPGFGAWMEGEPLDPQRLLYTPSGTPRVAIFSIAHLNEAERMFFVSLLLNQVLGWMRTLSGTTSLRAIVYMDEIFGYLPPTANPPSKVALLTLMKQARAFGVGMVLATQNPVDLDYKALSNAGTWFIGRLQTERDQLRVLDALEGVSAGAGGTFDRQSAGRTLAALGDRVFLMHNVHDDAPTVFETRWVMSYLRGPLTRSQIKTLMDPRRGEFAASTPPAGAAAPPAPPTSAIPPSGRPVYTTAPVLPPGVDQYFAPVPGPALLSPMLVGAADVQFSDPKADIDEVKTVLAVTPIVDAPVSVDWTGAQEAPFELADLSHEPPAGARFVGLPPAAQNPRSYGQWTKAFTVWLTRSGSLELLRSARYGIVSRPGEQERDFRTRVSHLARERRDDEVAGVRQKYAPKVAQLQDRLRRAQQAVQKEQEQAAGSRVQTAISLGTTLLGAMLGAMLGRRAVSASTLGRATTAARGLGRSQKEAQDVARAQENVKALERQIQELDASLQADLGAIDDVHAAAYETFETVSLKPRRGGVQVRLVALTWVAE